MRDAARFRDGTVTARKASTEGGNSDDLLHRAAMREVQQNR